MKFSVCGEVAFKSVTAFEATRAFGPRCVKAESLGPEGSMIGYETKNKRMNEQYKIIKMILQT